MGLHGVRRALSSAWSLFRRFIQPVLSRQHTMKRRPVIKFPKPPTPPSSWFNRLTRVKLQHVLLPTSLLILLLFVSTLLSATRHRSHNASGADSTLIKHIDTLNSQVAAAQPSYSPDSIHKLLQERLNMLTDPAFALSSSSPKPEQQTLSLIFARLAQLGPIMHCPAETAPGNTGSDQRKYMLAVNLRDSQALMPNLIHQILQLVAHMPATSLYVSVYESGSKDGTASWLKLLQSLLEVLKVRHSIVYGGQLMRTRSLGRIEFLAQVRNAALRPILNVCHPSTSATEGSEDDLSRQSSWCDVEKIVFLNDVFFCAEQVIRLLQYDSNIACGMDFEKIFADLPLLQKQQHMAHHLRMRFHVPSNIAQLAAKTSVLFGLWKKVFRKHPSLLGYLPLMFYDIWVARDQTGQRFTRSPPYTANTDIATNIKQGAPFPVYCCWNGLAVLDAVPFKQGLRFRSHKDGECAASECSLTCDDFHRLGLQNVVVDPSVRVAYNWLTARQLYLAPDGTGTPGFKPWHDQLPVQLSAAWQQVRQQETGTQRVDCCDLQAGKDQIDFEHDCRPVNIMAINYTSTLFA